MSILPSVLSPTTAGADPYTFCHHNRTWPQTCFSFDLTVVQRRRQKKHADLQLQYEKPGGKGNGHLLIHIGYIRLSVRFLPILQGWKNVPEKKKVLFHNLDILFQMHIPIHAVEHNKLPVEKRQPWIHQEVFYSYHLH